MTYEEEQYLRMGKEIARIAGDLSSVVGIESGYARRNVTFRTGLAVTVFVVKDQGVADAMEEGVSRRYAITDVRSVLGNDPKV